MLYTKLDELSLQQIVQQFNIAPILKWEILEGGSENTNYLLETTQQKYVLTLCERKTVAEATVLVNLLRHLESKQFKTTTIVDNKKEQAISFFNQKPIILKEYIAGQILQTPTTAILKKIGKSIGKLHLIPAPKYLPKVYSYGQQVFSELNDTTLDHPFKDWLYTMLEHIRATINPSLPKALIHGDIFDSNVVIDQFDQPIIIDFEEACYYYRMYEIGMAIIGLCKHEGTIDFTKAQHLISGYEQINPLTVAEKDALKDFIGYAATATAFWRFRQFNIIAPTPSHKDRYLEMKNIADAMRG